MALAIGAALVLAWAVDARRLRAEWPGVALAFVAVPMLVYLVSYGAWFGQHGLHLGRFAALQHDMAQYHATLTQGHLYQANPWGWLLLLRPTALYFTGGETIHHILAVGNPALWWPSIPALAVVVVMAARPARWDARFVAAFALGQYVPWLGVSRLTFLYYMTPVVPFLALGLVMAIAAVPRPARTAVAAVATALVSLAAAFFLPLWIGYGVSSAYWQRLMIFRSWI
jgi:dolichyl-phosphate-mannose--protein O-mannosyl transferase